MRSSCSDRSPARAFFALFVLVSSLWCTPILLAAPDAQEADESEEAYAGNFTLVFDPARSAALKPFEKKIRESQLLDATIEELNETLALPNDLTIAFTECGKVNAFYDGANNRVLMCYELMAFFQREFSAAYEDKDQAEDAVMDSLLFIFHHELGHALVDQLELPITGKEEDAVDDLATLVLLHEWEGGDESALSAANAFYMIGEQEESSADGLEKLPFYDEHSLGKQRYYQIACIVYGSDPAAHADLVGESLPKERAERCQAEYEQKARSWERLLADFYTAADEEEVEENAEELMGALGDDEEIRTYQVVTNSEGRLSLFAADREPPLGWEAVGVTGSRQECLDYIRERLAE